MASQPIEDEDQDDILELDEPLDQEDGGEGEQEPEGEGEGFVGFADEPDAAPADTDLVKHLRQQIRDRDKRLSEVQRAAPAEEPVVVGERPKMADFDYDEERFDEARDAWDERRRAAEKQEAARNTQKQRQEEDWNNVVRSYADKKAALRYSDVQTAEETAFAALSGPAQALIAKYADNPALFVYAIGKSPTKLGELTRIVDTGDTGDIIKAITKMEANVQTKKAPRAPDPDTPVRGRVVPAGSSDKQLAKLEAEAERTGKRDAVIAFKRAQKEARK